MLTKKISCYCELIDCRCGRRGERQRCQAILSFEQKPTFSICTSEKRRRWKHKKKPRGIFHFTQRLRITRDLTQHTCVGCASQAHTETHKHRIRGHVQLRDERKRAEQHCFTITRTARYRRYRRWIWLELPFSTKTRLHVTKTGCVIDYYIILVCFCPKHEYPNQRLARNKSEITGIWSWEWCHRVSSVFQ